MGGMHGRGDTPGVGKSSVCRQRSARARLCQVGTIYKIHGKIRMPAGFTHFVNCHDIGMLETCCYLSFTLKPKGVANKAKFNDFLNEGVPGLLRLKGFLQVEGVEPQAILQWTGGHWEMIPRPSVLREKPNVLVFIGEDLDRHAIVHKLEECGLEFDAAEHAHAHSHDHDHEHHHHEH